MPKPVQPARAADAAPELVEILAISERVTQMLLKGLDPNAWRAVAPLGGQIALLARQAGLALDKKLNFGMWEWGSLWRECGLGE